MDTASTADPPLRPEDLLVRWRGGDVGAGQALFERCIGPLYRYFCNKTDVWIEDVIHETMVGCLLERGPDGGDFTAWMLRVARRKLHARYRSAGEHLDPSTSSIAALFPTREPTLDRSSFGPLFDALRRLPLELQEAIELHYWESWSCAEIAAIVGGSELEARARIVRAKSLLAQMLASHATVVDDATCLPWEAQIPGIRAWLTAPPA